jgi:3-deoxy-manno-octulosonate cytidylyltransferase (CMP-KDO synthetase)
MKSIKFYVIIPARLNSSRLPNKVLIDLHGKTMLERTWNQALMSNAHEVIIATDSNVIMKEASKFGAKVCFTSSEHSSGTERIQEACSIYGLSGEDIIVNVQADEPMINPNAINKVAHELANNNAEITTLKTNIIDQSDYKDPNQVKVVSDINGYALYFSRAPIPWDKTNNNKQLDHIYKHIGIYAYKVSILNKFVTMEQNQLEKIEGLEQLRLLANGYNIYTALFNDGISIGVDTHEDLNKVRKLLANVE